MPENPVIAIGSDHHGLSLKPALKKSIEALKGEWLDLGPHNEDSVDYPDYANDVVNAITSGRAHYGILICGSGIGMSMVANRDPSIRAALCHDVEAATMTRKHNDANILVLSAKSTAPETAANLIKAFLTTDFEGGRHQRRIEKFSERPKT